MKQRAIILFTLFLLPISLSSCDSITIIGNSFRLLFILNSLEYESIYSGNLPITEDIQIIGTVTILSNQLKIPKKCMKSESCRESVGFLDSYGADGISLTPGDVYPSSSLTLTDIKLRFRPLIMYVGPLEFPYAPVIWLMPPSDYECEDTQIRCDVDQVCYDDYRSYCLFCLALNELECGCRDENGIFDDETPCEIHGDDTIGSGKCRDGECIPD